VIDEVESSGGSLFRYYSTLAGGLKENLSQYSRLPG
jgi:hypothetical protein